MAFNSTIIHGFWVWCFYWHIALWCIGASSQRSLSSLARFYRATSAILGHYLLSVLQHRSYRIAHRHWHTLFCGVCRRRGLLGWKCFGASEQDWRPCWRLASRFDGMSMWTRVNCPPVWLVTISTNWWCCTHNNYTSLPFVDVLHFSLMMLYLSVRQTYDTWVQWIWQSRDGHVRANPMLEQAEI